MTLTAQQWRDRAMAAKAAGDLAEADAIFAQGIAAFPGSAPLLNSFGSFLASSGRHDDALIRFEAALAADPHHAEALCNSAISLSRLGRATDALALLVRQEKSFAKASRYWAVRAATARELGKLDEAARAYDALLRIEASHARGLHGRARVALERGETDMCARFEQALPHNRADAAAFLGYAQALACSGRMVEARELAETLVSQLPAWTDGLLFLAQLRWGAGETDRFCDHFAQAAAAAPHDPAIPLAWAAALSGTDRHAEAAAVAGRAFSAQPDDLALALAEAEHAGAAGDLARTDEIFSAFTVETAEFKLAEARHRLRQRTPDRAEV
ncbi:MAG: hypothetical protein B7X78_08490, partial [Sphingomonadales bacterium 39-62-4]